MAEAGATERGTPRRQLERTVKRALPGFAKPAVANLLRGYGMATSAIRPLPDFLIIGGKRCGTTSLFGALVQHPCVTPLFPSAVKVKGVHYFDREFARGAGWYRSHFATSPYRWVAERRARHPVIAGEASSYCLHHPLAPERAASLIPGAILIVLLRNPVDRAYSHYRARVRAGAEELSFDEALDREPSRLAGEEERLLTDPGYRSEAHEHRSYASQGIYLVGLERWMARYPREQLLVLRSEDLYQDPATVYAEVLRYLGLPRWIPPSFPTLNAGGGELLDPAIRERLTAYFAPHNERLAAFLGVDLCWESAVPPHQAQ
jgi:hypothetical protein